MSVEDKVLQELLKGFPFLENKARIQRQRRIFVDLAEEKFFEVFDYCVKQLNFSILSAITGLDEGEVFGFIYHISRDDGVVLSLKINIPRENLVLKTVTDYFLSAEIYERELVDLLGVKVEGLKEGKRYPLPDDWPAGQYPLRKGWNAEVLKRKGNE
jgi:membrane-bound hydrogenase subunit beta